MSETMFVVEGAILGCTGCMDSLLRNSGPGIIVFSQRTRRVNGRPIATARDIGIPIPPYIGISIPPFSHCDVLGACTPVVTSEWIETDDSMNPPTLVFGQSITFCDAGGGVILTLTSGQNPEEDSLSREEEIERVFQFFKLMNEVGKEAGGWTVGGLSDVQLRNIAADYVDVMRAITANRDANGYSDMSMHGQDVLDAFSRLANAFDLSSAANNYNTFLVMHGLGSSQWPMVNGSAVFGLSIDRAIPNSTLKDLLIAGGIIAGVSLPLWGPAAVGAITTGAKSAWAYLQAMGGGAVALWERIKQIFTKTPVAPRIDPNSLNHIFGKTQHNLGPLVQQFGSQINAYNAVWRAAQAQVAASGLTGVFHSVNNPIIVNVGGSIVHVGGIVIDGVLRIGTFFIP